MPTLSMTSAHSITASANPPRAAFTDFPLGHTCGPPDRPVEQRSIMRDALALFETMDRPGIVDLGYTWPAPWKEAALRPGDHRTPRHDTPQYQNRDDREAAVVAYGVGIACRAGIPGDVPRC
ncbi:MAG: hypothetical protein F4176_00055 [Acidimicrobiia bacterium]|nr:hypothetical protein [Acidimicrobiia bacterium]